MLAEERTLPRLRRSARVLLLDERDDVLLIRLESEVAGEPFACWVTPGGEVEAGEDDRAAAERELAEELGLRLPLHGPVHVEGGGEYVHLGERVRNRDVFFAARCGRGAPRLAGVTSDEIRLMREARWWSPAEVSATEELVFPRCLAELIPGVRVLLARSERDAKPRAQR